MKNSRLKHRLPIYIFVICAVVFITFQTTYLLVNESWESRVTDMIKTDKTTISENLTSLDSIVKSKSVSKLESNSLLDGTISGYMSGINDRYALYMNKEQYADYITGTSQGTSVGIGISALYDSTANGIYIVNVYPSSPAQSAGIKPGDIITHVNGLEVVKTGFYSAMLKIGSGEAYTGVVLRVKKPDGTSVDLTVTRDVVITKNVTQSLIETDIGVIKINEFTSSTSDDFKSALEELIQSGADRFIIDIRNNPGGDISSITPILDFLLPDGTLMTATDKDGAIRETKSDVNEFTSPFAVLVNRNTVCAAELFAAAVKDFKKAPVVGEKTYGKATAQQIFTLPSGGAVSFSTVLYTPPSGVSFENEGVTPDYAITLSDDELYASDDILLNTTIEVVKTLEDNSTSD